MRNRRIQLNIVFIYLIGCGLIISIIQILYTVDKINIASTAFQETHNNIDKINGRQLDAQSENSHRQWLATVTSRKHFYGPGKTQ